MIRTRGGPGHHGTPVVMMTAADYLAFIMRDDVYTIDRYAHYAALFPGELARWYDEGRTLRKGEYPQLSRVLVYA